MKRLLLCLGLLVLALPASGEVTFKPIEYREGDTVLEGLWMHDDASTSKRPGILIAHQWKGLGEYERRRGEMLARLGYNVLAVDIYGKGIRPGTRESAAATAGKFKESRALLKQRMRAGLDVLRQHPLTDTMRIAAIGYCFGGTAVLELARSGADMAGVVSFHGGLGTPNPTEANHIKCKVLALHGADDPAVPQNEVLAFQEEMRQANVDWQLISYGGAVHSFTDWNAGNDNSKGVAYNEKADKRSWEAMKQFFAEIFR
jgi:dienelactone hydrolase